MIVNHPLPAANETPETHMAFSFAWMTSDEKYGFKGLHKMKGNDAAILESLFEFLETISKNPWSFTKHRNRYNGGYEELPVAEMEPTILNGMDPEKRAEVTSVMVFRFNDSKDRLIALKEQNVLYILGFDLHFNLYDHGS
ncbi:hypothetical protein AAK899_02160 [Erysipelotrichaceae bacterium 51-3]|uniref:hypothetical protein n=1 Tax=Allobaculum sp. JKK-2023 TaxID=3108943 RepID=UPI002B057A46|nr:hypothetical protein [Allobaculum sp. JKK-2023]